MANSTRLCETMASIVNSPVPYVFAFKGLWALLGFFASFFTVKAEGISWLVHPNAKLLYALHIAWSLYLPGTLMLSYAYETIRLFIPRSDPCQYLLPATIAVPLKFVSAYGVLVQSFTMFCIALERAIATMYPSKYEKVKSATIGIILGLLSPIIAAIVDTIVLLLPVNWKDFYPMGILTTDETSKGYQVFLIGHLVLEVVTICIFIIILKINRRRDQKANNHYNSLGKRYQGKENTKIIETLLPCFMVHFALNIVMVAGLQLYFVFLAYDEVKYTINMEIWAQVHLYAVIMPIIIRMRLRKRRSRRITNVQNTSDHFEILKTMFDK